MAQRKRLAVYGPDEPHQMQDGQRGSPWCHSGFNAEDGARNGATFCPLCEAEEFPAWDLQRGELTVDYDKPLGPAAVLGDVFAGELLQSGKAKAHVAVTVVSLEGSRAAEAHGAGDVIVNEMDMLCRLTRHINRGGDHRVFKLVEVQGYRYLPCCKVLWIATESGMDLLAWMRKCGGHLGALDAVRVGRHVSCALRKLHACGFAHGGICPSSIVMPHTSYVCLGNVGMWRLCYEVLGLQVPIHTLAAYRAPELTPPDLSATKQADVWALAATLLHALTGQLPGSEGAGCRGASEIPPDVPPPLADVLRDCFSDVPSERPTAVQLHDRLKSVFAALLEMDNEPPFQMFVRLLNGKTATFETSSGTLVRDFKLLIRDKAGAPPDQQRLIFAGRQLEDCLRLGDYDVRKDCTVDLTLRLRGC